MAANTLGRYHIIREIARSNDIVYEAMDPAQGKKIALKELLMPQNLAGQARHERIQRFTREARSAARLKHPNIVRIFDHNQVQGRYYIAMEFLEGQSLRDVLRQRGAMPLQEALRIATCVAEGLEFAHKNGVVHRDIKPDNVHLEPDGRVVITDFGIARLTFEPSLTADGQIFGTPSYMSPEQVTGKGIDKRSDLFSLGVMLYEMVSGRKPFTGDSVITITYNIMNVEPPPLTGAPPGVEQVVRKAMAKDPARRYQSAAEMVEDLQLVARGAPPRHASAVPAASSAVGTPAPVPPRPTATPGPVPRAPQAGPRPMPRPVFGAPAGGPPRSAPVPGPVPGARPMPPPAPWGASAAQGHVNGVPPMSAPGYPPGVPAVAGAPQPFPAVSRGVARREGGFDYKWFLGWLGIAVVIAGIILLIVWSSVMAYDRFNQERGAAAISQAYERADQAFRNEQYEEALAGYLEAMKGARGEQLAVVRHNASNSAMAIARKQVDAGKAADAEKYARQALELNPDSAWAYVALGRARALQGDVDAAVKAFDDAAAAANRVLASGSPQAQSEARDAAAAVPSWKASVLLTDGEKQMSRNVLLARQRFEAVIATAPNTDFARNARIYLQRLGSSGAVPVDPSTTPGVLADPPDAGTPPSQPEGWDNSYRNAVPNSAPSAPSSGLLPPPGIPRLP